MMENLVKQKNQKLVIYSFFLAVLVLLLHNTTSYYFNNMNRGGVGYAIHFFISSVMVNVETVAVPSFFILSAFLFYRNFTLAKTKDKLKSRFYSLVIPYLIWNTVSVAFEMLFCSFASGYMNYSVNPFDLKEILKGVLFSKYNIFWFIEALILYNLFCVVFYKVLSKTRTGIIAILLASIAYITGVFRIRIFDCHFETSSIIYYGIGAYFGIHYPDLINKRFRNKGIVVAAITFSALVFLNCILENIAIPTQIYRGIDIAMNLLKSIMLWIAVDMFIFCVPNIKLWSRSFIIYAVHWNVQKIIMTIIRIVCSKLIGGFVLEELIVWATSSGIALACIICFAALCERYTPKMYAVITGNRG